MRCNLPVAIPDDFFDFVMEECGDEAVGIMEQIYRRSGFHYALVDNGNLPEAESQLRRGLTASLAGKLSTIDIRIHEYEDTVFVECLDKEYFDGYLNSFHDSYKELFFSYYSLSEDGGHYLLDHKIERYDRELLNCYVRFLDCSFDFGKKTNFFYYVALFFLTPSSLISLYNHFVYKNLGSSNASLLMMLSAGACFVLIIVVLMKMWKNRE